jgi:tRNA(His) guanylyltransferase
MNSEKLSLGGRMKDFYETRQQSHLIRRTPVIIRLDGKAFHTLTRKYFKGPHNLEFSNIMRATALKLCDEIQGAKCAYVQSDEISIFVSDYDSVFTDCWFDYNIQKIVSVSSAIASVEFSFGLTKLFFNDDEKGNLFLEGYFDSRVFNIPKEEVRNYFIWRQKDCERNSVSSTARMYYSQKQLNLKKKNELHELLFAKGVNWADLPDWVKNGVFITRKEGKFVVNENCPVFTTISDFFELIEKDKINCIETTQGEANEVL